MCLPTHPHQGFCEIWEKGEIRVEKGDFRGDLGGFEGFGLCLGISHPPTHIWERSP